MDKSGWIDLVLSRAAELRAAGVTAIAVDKCSATFTPLDPYAGAKPDDAPALEQPSLDPLHDPHSYPGGFVPGFDIEKYPVHEE